MTRYVAPVVALCTMAGWTAHPHGQGAPPGVTALLSAAGAYVAEYETRASAVVFEEHYEQTLNRRDPQRVTITHRELRSELAVIHTPDTGWIGFRDVFEVDGKPIRDRQDRLETLFLEPSTTTISEARLIADEGARFNLGAVQRNLNYPTMALIFLRATHQGRSTFAREGGDTLSGIPTYVLSFTETARPSLIGAGQGDVVTSGRFWIEPGTGRIRRSQVTVKEGLSDCTITVTYGPWSGLEILLPVSLEERLSFRGATPVWSGPKTTALLPVVEVLSGRARYSNPKRFTVDTDTAIRVPK